MELRGDVALLDPVEVDHADRGARAPEELHGVGPEGAHAADDDGLHPVRPNGVFGRIWMRLYGLAPVAAKRSITKSWKAARGPP